MVLTLPDVLAGLGHRLQGAPEAACFEESLSALDKVRRCAFSNDTRSITPPPPMLLADSLTPGGFFVFDPPKGEETFFNSSERSLNLIPELRVVGGAMLQAKHVSFPAIILFSNKNNTLVVHASNAPLAALEAELYDTAFDDENAWEKLVCQDRARETVQWRKGAAMASINAGFLKTPSFVIAENDLNVVRHGIGPLLSLRCIENGVEFDMVTTAALNMLRRFPLMSREDTRTARMSQGIITSMFLQSSNELQIDPDSHVSKELEEKAIDACKRASLTWVASVVLHGALDDAFDSNGESVSEYDTGLKHNSANDSIYDEQSANERALIEGANSAPSSDLQGFNDLGYSLPAVMKGLNRPYTTVAIADRAETDQAYVIKEVVSHIFATEEFEAAKSLIDKKVTDTMTLSSALETIGTILCDSQALVIALREQDGRFAIVKMLARKKRVENISLTLFSRLVLFPWVRIIIVDCTAVSELLVRNPIELGERQPMRIYREPGKSLDNGIVAQTVETLSSKVYALTEANESLKKSVDAFDRKLGIILSNQLEKEEKEEKEPPRAEQEKDTDLSTLGIKRTLETLIGFQNKKRAVDGTLLN
jgi:hypothetical protein